MAVKYPLSIIVRALDKATAPVRAMAAGMAKALRPVNVGFARVSNRLGALAREAGLPRLVGGFRGVGSALGKVGQEVSALGKRLLAMGGIAGAVLFGIARSAINAGDDLATIADRLGLTVDWFAQTQFAAEQADVPAEKFAEAMDTLAKRVGEAKAGGGELLAFLTKVSPTLARQVKQATSTEEAFGLLTRAFERVTDPAKRAALGAAVFGRGAKQMATFAGMGSAAIDVQRKRFTELSGSQERFARGAGELDNAVRESQVAFLGLRNAVAGELFPALTELAKVVTSLVAGNRESLVGWAREAGAAVAAWVKGGGVQRLVDGLSNLVEVGRSLVERLGGWRFALAALAAFMAGPLLASIGGLISAVITLGAAIGFTPVGWILAGLAAIAAAAVLVWRNFDSIKAVIGPAFAPLLPKLQELGAEMKRLWGVLGPVLVPVLKVVGALLGVAFVAYVQLLARWVGHVLKLANLFVIAMQLVARWVGRAASVITALVGGLASVAEWATRAGAAVADAFSSAWEKVRPIAEALKEVAKLTTTGRLLRAGAEVVGLTSPTPAAPAPLRLPGAGGGGGETRVVVDFNGLPRGARVAADPQGDAPVDLNLGYTMVGP